jgi:hypothetical protein
VSLLARKWCLFIAHTLDPFYLFTGFVLIHLPLRSSTATAISDNGLPRPTTSNSLTKTIVACVLSILVTLALVTILFILRRLRNRRRATAAATASSNDIYKGASIKRKLRRSRAEAYNPGSSEENQLDLIASRSSREDDAAGVGHIDRRELVPIVTSLRATSPFDDSPTSMPISAGGAGRSRVLLPLAPSRSTTFDSAVDVPSPVSDVTRGRNASQDALLGYAAYNYDVPPPLPPQRERSRAVRGGGILRLHDASGSGGQTGIDGEEGEVEEEVSDLKRDTLAFLGEEPPIRTNTNINTNREGELPRRAATATPSGRRRRQSGEQREMEYMVHRDAGRVRTNDAGTGRVLELPPRYEELDWDEEDEEARARQTR